MNGLARNRINRELIARNWDDMLRVAGSLKMGTVGAVELMRSLESGSRASRLGQALAELGRIPKTVHLLTYFDDEEHRRFIGRQLTRLGRLEFEVITGGAGLRDVLAECFALETLGWKGQRGAPISSRPDTLQFYTEVAHWAAARGILRLFFCRLDGRMLTFELCLEDNNRLYDIKGGMDPVGKPFSAGVLSIQIAWRANANLACPKFFQPARSAKEWNSAKEKARSAERRASVRVIGSRKNKAVSKYTPAVASQPRRRSATRT